ncbi:MAG TPA: NAD-dependent epimerase/dehydratase family protein, partial [Longimicrobiaceae bacterium]|nr:NAD-dependent epimerase/dehydratase family protein [Longimicrobiaceae bacterium]
MRVFLTGGTGYVGSAVARALARVGHVVVALARSDEAARWLEAEGHRVLRGDLADPESLTAGAREADAVVHAASTGDARTGNIDRAAVEALLGALEGSGKSFLYTSGTWVHGSTGGRVADEDAPFDPAAPLVAWRPAVERRVRDAAGRGVRGVVIRPAVVYGRGGGTPAMLARAARTRGVVRYVGDGSQRWSTVHVDDLADLYVLALDADPGSAFVAAHGPAHAVREIAEAAALPWGARVEPWPLEEARARLGA